MNEKNDQLIIDVALTLMAEHRFDAISMTDIARATGVSAGALQHRLVSTEAAVLAVADDMLIAVAKALADNDVGRPVADTLLNAYWVVLAAIIGGYGPMSVQRMRCLTLAIMSSSRLQQVVAARRALVLSAAVTEQRGVGADDPQVARELKLWSAVVAALYASALNKQGRVDPLADLWTLNSMRDRLSRVFCTITGRSVAL